MHIYMGGTQQVEIEPHDVGKVLVFFSTGGWDIQEDGHWSIRRTTTNELLTPIVRENQFRMYELTRLGEPDPFTIEAPIFDCRVWSFMVHYEYLTQDPDANGPITLDGRARIQLQTWDDGKFEVLITTYQSTEIRLHPDQVQETTRAATPGAEPSTRFTRIIHNTRQ